jgi:hypothetical protein
MRSLTIAVLTIGIATAACNKVSSGAAAKEPEAGAPAAAVPAAFDATARPLPKDGQPAVETASARSPADGGTAAAPAWREVTIPAGTALPLVLDTGIGSDISRVEQPVRAHLARAIVVRGTTVLAQGSPVSGVVTDARRSGKVKGLAHVAVRFDTLTPRGVDERYRIHTTAVGRTAPATKKKDAIEIGAPAAGGAVIGAIVGGKKGAAIGSAVGGGGGTAVVLATRGKEVRMGRGALVTVRLAEPLTVRVKS